MMYWFAPWKLLLFPNIIKLERSPTSVVGNTVNLLHLCVCTKLLLSWRRRECRIREGPSQFWIQSPNRNGRPRGGKRGWEKEAGSSPEICGVRMLPLHWAQWSQDQRQEVSMWEQSQGSIKRLWQVESDQALLFGKDLHGNIWDQSSWGGSDWFYVLDILSHRKPEYLKG